MSAYRQKQFALSVCLIGGIVCVWGALRRASVEQTQHYQAPVYSDAVLGYGEGGGNKLESSIRETRVGSASPIAPITVSLVTIDGLTGRPVSNALIDGKKPTTTEEREINGRSHKVIVIGVTNQRQALVSAPGYQERVVDIASMSGKDKSVSLWPIGELHGLVYGKETSAPIEADVQITWKEPYKAGQGVYKSKASATLGYTAGPIPIGVPLSIRASALAHAEYSHDFVLDARSVEFDIAMHCGVLVTGRCIDEWERPVSEAGVVMHGTVGSQSGLYLTALTAGDGYFTVGPVAPGKYIATATVEGVERGRTPIDINDCEEQRDYNIPITRQPTLTARIYNQQGEPVRDALVQVMLGERSEYEGKTNDEGKVAFSVRAQAIHGYMKVGGAPNDGLATTLFAMERDWSVEQYFRVAASSSGVLNIHTTSAPPSSLYRLAAKNDGPELSGHLLNGRAQLELDPGVYTISILDAAGAAIGVDLAEVVSGNDSTVEIACSSNITLHGVVLHSRTNRPISGALIQLYGGSGTATGESIYTNAGGEFVMDRKLDSIWNGRLGVTHSDFVQVDAGELLPTQTSGLVLEMDAPSSLQVEVDGDANVVKLRQRQGADWIQKDGHKHEGVYNFTGLAPGVYQLRAGIRFRMLSLEAGEHLTLPWNTSSSWSWKGLGFDASEQAIDDWIGVVFFPMEFQGEAYAANIGLGGRLSVEAMRGSRHLMIGVRGEDAVSTAAIVECIQVSPVQKFAIKTGELRLINQTSEDCNVKVILHGVEGVNPEMFFPDGSLTLKEVWLAEGGITTVVNIPRCILKTRVERGGKISENEVNATSGTTEVILNK